VEREILHFQSMTLQVFIDRLAETVTNFALTCRGRFCILPFIKFLLPNYVWLFEKYLKFYSSLQMVTKKLLQYLSNVGSESLHRKIGDNDNLLEDISFIS
jgi:hypothetical protein